MENETYIRLGFFFGIFAVMAGWEFISPRITLKDKKPNRWLINISLTTFNTVLARIALPIIPVLFAAEVASSGNGLLNYLVIPQWAKVIVGVVILDFVIYLQHVMFHTLPVLWRLHMVHHADLGIDVTTGLRFHPLEILISFGIKLAAIAAFGVGPLAVLIFEVVLNGTAMFNHSNVYIPTALDRAIRSLIVTPDMHRVHHSVIVRETNSNFGFNLSIWDRLCGTYRPQPESGHDGMTIGMAQQRERLSFGKLMIFPFNGDPGRYPINGWGGDPKGKLKKKH